MEAVETGDHAEWTKVLDRTGNTVCGRHPIGVMMAAVEEWRKEEEGREGKGVFRFVRYERSELVKRVQDSSVSYCSAYAVF
jgi:MEMO1 family protein